MLNSCRGLKGIGRNVQWCASHPPEAETALPTPIRQCAGVFHCLKWQASGFRWWVRKSSSHQECSSPAELSCILPPTQRCSIHHLYNVTVGDKTWAQKEPMIQASPIQKEPNYSRMGTISDTWSQPFCAVIEDSQWPSTGVFESRPLD